MQAEAFFRSCEWPRQRKTQGEKQEGGSGGGKGWGGRNINETGVKEKYWADVAVQMQNAWAHVSGSGRGGAQKKAGAAKRRRRQREVRGDWRWTAERSRNVLWKGADVRHRGPRDTTRIIEDIKGVKIPERKSLWQGGGHGAEGGKERMLVVKNIKWSR